MLFNPIEQIPTYILHRFPTYDLFQEALRTGQVVRDQFGIFRFREEFLPVIYNYPYHLYYLMAQSVNPPIPNPINNTLDFSFFNIENIRGCYKIDTDGYVTRLVNAEDIARGAGLTKIDTDKRRQSCPTESCRAEYLQFESIRWNTFNEYAKDSLNYIVLDREMQYFTFPIGKDSYIPLKLATMIVQHCTSKTARQFQGILTDKVMDIIDREIDDRNKEALEKLKGQVDNKDRQIEEQTKVTEHITNYYQQFNSTDHCFTATELAKNYGLSAQTFNKLLHRLHMIYMVNGTWQVYQRYIDLGCTTIRNENGQSQTYWTENGKLVISALLLNYGIEEGKPNQDIVDRLLED